MKVFFFYWWTIRNDFRTFFAKYDTTSERLFVLCYEPKISCVCSKSAWVFSFLFSIILDETCISCVKKNFCKASTLGQCLTRNVGVGCGSTFWPQPLDFIGFWTFWNKRTKTFYFDIKKARSKWLERAKIAWKRFFFILFCLCPRSIQHIFCVKYLVDLRTI